MDSDSDLDMGPADNATAPKTLHFSGERTEDQQPEELISSISSSSSSSSSSSASSPSENETSNVAQQSNKSASSPSSESDTAAATEPTTSNQTHSVRRPPSPSERPNSGQRKSRTPVKKRAPAALGKGDTPPVSPTYEKPYHTRHDRDLEKQTTARTLTKLREETNKRNLKSFPAWDSKKGMPPQAFTEGCYDEEFCLPFVNWYKQLEPIVKERQAADLRAKGYTDAKAAEERAAREAQAAAQRMTVDDELDLDDTTPFSPTPAAVANIDQLLQGKPAQKASLPAPSTVPSTKPAKVKPKKTKTHDAVVKKRAARAETTHSVAATAPSASKKTEEKRKTVASTERQQSSSKDQEHSSRSDQNSKRSREPFTTKRGPPAKEARRTERSPSPPPTPNMARHLQRTSTTKSRTLIPVMDGHVDKAMAVYVAMQGHQQNPWIAPFLDEKKPFELLGCINSYGVPASYIHPEHCRPGPGGDHTPLATVTYDQIRTENTILPWNFILTNTLGALPSYWRQCASKTREHLKTPCSSP